MKTQTIIETYFTKIVKDVSCELYQRNKKPKNVCKMIVGSSLEEMLHHY